MTFGNKLVTSFFYVDITFKTLVLNNYYKNNVFNAVLLYLFKFLSRIYITPKTMQDQLTAKDLIITM